MKNRAWAFALLAAGLATAAHAEDTSGFYAGSGAGMYTLDFDGLDFDESAPTLRVFGGYRLNEYVSFEAGFTNLFEASRNVSGIDVEVDGTTWDLSVRPSFPINDRFSAFGVLGWTEYDFEISASGGGVTATGSGSDGDLEYGLGGAWNVTDQWMLRGEWLMVDVSDADFSMFSVSATYNFR